MVAVNIAAVSEALTFAKKAGTDPELVYQAIRGGLAGSTVMDAKAPMMLERNFKPGFRIELHIKDLNNALNAAHAVSSPVPLTGQLMEMMQCLKADGGEKIFDYGVDSIMPTINGDMDIEEALARAEELYVSAAERMFRMLRVGTSMKK